MTACCSCVTFLEFGLKMYLADKLVFLRELVLGIHSKSQLHEMCFLSIGQARAPNVVVFWATASKGLAKSLQPSIYVGLGHGVIFPVCVCS